MTLQLPQEYYSKFSRSLMLTLGSLAFVVGGIFLITHASEMDSPTKAMLAGWACALFCGACGLIGIRGLFKRALILTLTHEGIQLPKGTLVRWTDTAGFGVVIIRSTKLVGVIFNDPEAWMAQNSRRSWKVNYALTGSPVVFSMSPAAIKAKDMVATLEELRLQYGVRHG